MDYIKELGYPATCVVWYKLPGLDLENRLKLLDGDSAVLRMFKKYNDQNISEIELFVQNVNIEIPVWPPENCEGVENNELLHKERESGDKSDGSDSEGSELGESDGSDSDHYNLGEFEYFAEVMSSVGGSRYTPPPKQTSYSGQTSTSSHHSGPAENHLLLCECGIPAVMRTSWTPTILGDVFEGAWAKGHYCSTFEWVDEPGSERCMTVIPGLLRRLSRSTTDAKAFEERIRSLEGRMRNMRTKMYIIAIGAAFSYFVMYISCRPR
ncbi:hypothetical protein Salat_1927800 [Sesamum alatum]|uniref:Uncharacterized protein n=1 Tax=Sesamum alatum TaxID=300844 RepID=A0AAE1Y4I9_9LAMI|nr:hypothetical protein Salat_1927800 [Sesamum alatum]